MQLSCLPLDLKWMPRGTSGIGHILRWHFFGDIKGLFCLILEGNRYLSFILRKKFWQHSFLLLLGDFFLFHLLKVVQQPVCDCSYWQCECSGHAKKLTASRPLTGLSKKAVSKLERVLWDVHLVRIWKGFEYFLKCEQLYNQGRWDGKLPNCGIVSYLSWEDMP